MSNDTSVNSATDQEAHFVDRMTSLSTALTIELLESPLEEPSTTKRITSPRGGMVYIFYSQDKNED
jgi:hypothetical protein